MKINFDVFLKGLTGEAFNERVDGRQCPNCGFQNGIEVPFGKTTLKSVALSVLQFPFIDEGQTSPHPLSSEDKAKRGLLALRINANPKKIDLETGELDLIKKLIGKSQYNTFLIWQAHQLLEGKDLAEVREKIIQKDLDGVEEPKKPAKKEKE
jgi:hypothetical protein